MSDWFTCDEPIPVGQDRQDKKKKLGAAVFASTLNTHDDAAKHAYR
jgi:hypothetical protein